MQVQVPALVQVNFHLLVRKADLAVMSMKELDILTRDMDDVMNLIISKGYSATSQVTLDGVMTSINA